MNERRRAPRRRTYLGAQIALDGRSSTLSCLVRNLSDEGAKLVFPDSVPLPQAFDLTVEPRGAGLRARLVWRSATEVGVAFVEAKRPAGAAAVLDLDQARRLRAVERENAALKLRVEQLSSAE